MVEEIVYTSAEKGLKQGSRGFCTVVSTAGMSLALAERLESMSGYRHAFPLHDPQASLNPVCFAHVTTRLAGKSLHVISRVADAGQDYTGRSNKLAHHLVIDNVAGMPAGPARLMAEPGVIVERWDGNVRNVPPRELRCAPLPASIPLVAWQGLTGDEGWAGAVAEQLLQNPAPVSIIFNPGTDTLTLVREVLDLVPAAQRWNVTFSTYFTRLLAGAECQLRFVLNDTPEATSLRNDARARVIDLTNPLPAATGGTLVAMARKGQLTPQEPAPAPVVRARTAVEILTKDSGAEISVPKLKPGLSPLQTPDKPQAPRDVPPPVRTNSRMGVWVGLAVALILVVATGALIFSRSGKTHDPFADLVNKTVPETHMETETAEVTLAAEKAENDRLEREERDHKQKLAADEAAKKKAHEKKAADDKLVADQKAERLRQEAMVAKAKAAFEAKLAEEGPFIFLKTEEKWHDILGQWVSELPPPPPDNNGLQQQNVVVGPSLRVRKNAVELQLLEAAAQFFGSSPFHVELERKAPGVDVWIASAVQGNQTIGNIAEYSLSALSVKNSEADADFEMHFRWLRDAEREKQAAELLRWLPLQITVGDQIAVLLQRRAFRPIKSPTWTTLTDSTIFTFSKGPELEVLPWGGSSQMLFRLGINDGKNTQDIKVAVGHSASAKPLAKKAINSASSKTHLETKYFELQSPLLLKDTKPAITPSMSGYGQIAISVKHTSTDGFSFHPQVKIFLRIPTEAFMSEMIGSDQRKYLRDVQTSPNLLSQFNPLLAKAELEKLRKEFDAALSDVNEWRQLPPKQLPDEIEFDRISELISETTNSDSVKQFVKDFPLVDEKNASPQDNQVRRAVHEFIPKMEELQRAIEERTIQLKQNYPTQKKRVDDVIAEGSESAIECRLECILATPGAENGSEIRLVFLESVSSDSAP